MKKLISALPVAAFSLAACGGAQGTGTTAEKAFHYLDGYTDAEKTAIQADAKANAALRSSSALSSAAHRTVIGAMRQNLPEYDAASNTINQAFVGTAKYKELPANIQRIVKLFDEDKWEDVFNIRRNAYTYRGFLEAAAKYPSFCNEAASEGQFKDKDLDTVCKRELSSLFAHMTQEVGHDSLIVKTDGKGLVAPADRPTQMSAADHENGAGQGPVNVKMKRDGGAYVYPSAKNDLWKTGLHFTTEGTYVKGDSNWEGNWFGPYGDDTDGDGTPDNDSSLGANDINKLGKKYYAVYSTKWSNQLAGTDEAEWSWASKAYPNKEDATFLDGKTKNDIGLMKTKSYHGRGAKQLTWNFNYGELSYSLFDDFRLLENPDSILEFTSLSFTSALHFHMRISSNKPSMHEIVTGIWNPTDYDKTQVGTNLGFGAQILLTSAGECGTLAAPWLAKFDAAGAAEVNADAEGLGLPEAAENELVSAYNRKLYWSKFTEYFGATDADWYGSTEYTNDCNGVKANFWYPSYDSTNGTWSEPTDAQRAGLRNVFWRKEEGSNVCTLSYLEEAPFAVANRKDLEACNVSEDGISRKNFSYGPSDWSW